MIRSQPSFSVCLDADAVLADRKRHGSHVEGHAVAKTTTDFVVDARAQPWPPIEFEGRHTRHNLRIIHPFVVSILTDRFDDYGCYILVLIL